VIDMLLARIEGEWRASLEQAGVVICPPLSVLKIGDLSSMNCKINLLVFNARAQHPALVLRLAHTAEQKVFLNKEYQALSGLAGNPCLSKSIPLPLGLYELHRSLVAVEKYLPGVSMFALLARRQHMHPASVQRDFRLACDFLCELEQATNDGSLPFPGPDVVNSKVEQLAVAHGPLDLPKRTKERLLEIASACQSLSFRRCSRQGDFWPGNLLVSPQGLGVIDWEGYAHPDPIFHDIFFFMTTYALFYPWRGWDKCPEEQAFARGFLEKNWLANIINDTLCLFFQQWGLPPQAVYLLLTLYLIEMSLPAAIPNDPRYPRQYDKWFGLFQVFIRGKSLLLD